MAINRISGNILQDNLQRGSNLAVQANLTYWDVVNLRVGIKTTAPTTDFEVNGNIRSGNITLYKSGNLDVGNVNINNVAEPVANSDAATKYYTDSGVANVLALFGNLYVSNTTITSNIANANITLLPTNNKTVIIDTNSGLVMPQGNIAQRPSPAATGTLRWNTEYQRLEIYDGTEWDSVVSDVTNQTITPDGVANTFTLDRDSTTPATLISLNGVVQLPDVAYTVTGNSLQFTETPLTTDIIDVRFL